MDGLDKLPAWVQIAAFLGILLATTGASLAGWNRDKFRKLAGQDSNPAPGKDAVVLSAAIADSQSINNLAKAIDRMVDFLEQDREDHERRDRALRTCLQDVVDSNDRVASLLRQVLHPFATPPHLPPGKG